MERVKKIMEIFVLLIVLFSSIVVVNAAELTIILTTDKKQVQAGEEFVITVNWKEGMQIASFNLNYDSSKVEYVSSSISDDFVGTGKDGVLKIAWVSFSCKDKTHMTFKFKAKKSGDAKFYVTADMFSTGDGVEPEGYDVSSNVTVTVKGSEQQQPSTSSPTTKPTPETPSNTVENLPYTGKNVVILILPLVALMLISIVLLEKNKKYKGI